MQYALFITLPCLANPEVSHYKVHVEHPNRYAVCSSCRNLGDMTFNSGAYPILLSILRINWALSPIVSHDGVWLTIYIQKIILFKREKWVNH